MLPTLREVLLVGSDEEIAALPDTRNRREITPGGDSEAISLNGLLRNARGGYAPY